MSRILGLDWGEVRVGAAISDEEAEFAFPLEVAIESKKAVEEIKKIISENSVGLVLLGLPKNLVGEESHSAEKLKAFAEKLFDATRIPISLVDERFTTVQARKMLQSQGLPEKKQRGIKDNIAAQIMLQQYLNTKK